MSSTSSSGNRDNVLLRFTWWYYAPVDARVVVVASGVAVVCVVGAGAGGGGPGAGLRYVTTTLPWFEEKNTPQMRKVAYCH